MYLAIRGDCAPLFKGTMPRYLRDCAPIIYHQSHFKREKNRKTRKWK